MPHDGYVTIHRTTDAAQGELLAQMLRSEGIDARFYRVSSALIGIPNFMMEMTVDVPIKSEARARELLRDLEYVGAFDSARAVGNEADNVGTARRAEEGDGGETGEAAGTRAADASRRNPFLAPGFAFLLPGGAHLYARRPWTALVIAVGLVSCVIGLSVAGGALGLEAVATVAMALVFGDAIGSFRAARGENRGLQVTRGRQLAAGFGLLGVAVALGGSTRLTIGRSRELQLADYKVSCTGDAISVENRTGEARVVQLANLKISAHSFAGYEDYDIPGFGAGILHLAPGERGVVKTRIADWLDRSCGFGFAPEPPKASFAVEGIEQPASVGPRVLSCELEFAFFAREEGAAESAGLDASGSCVPPKGTRSESAGTLTARR